MNQVAPPGRLQHLDPSIMSLSGQAQPVVAGHPATSSLSAEEAHVLTALSDAGHCLTVGQLRARTGIVREELRPILEGLRDKGLAARLNTVVESYACRFPGVRVDNV